MARSQLWNYSWQLKFSVVGMLLQNKTMSKPLLIAINGLSKEFPYRGSQLSVFENLSFNIESGAITAIHGPNGTGKTTLLHILSGLVKQDSGVVHFSVPPVMGLVFQNYKESLLPWKTVEENILLPLVFTRQLTQPNILRILGLCHEFAPDLPLDRYPYQLSGGQQQMTCLIRSLALSPNILLLDEPFTSVDYENTFQLYQRLLKIWATQELTIVVVSHNIDDAIFLASNIILLSKSPTRIIVEVSNPLPYPRTPSLFSTVTYAALKSKLLSYYPDIYLPGTEKFYG